MIEQKIEKMNTFFAQRIAECERHGRELAQDERGDEAVLDRISGNVYDIFRTVLAAGIKSCRGEPEAVRRFFCEKLELIPSAWAASYEKAREHDDAVRMQIEKVKLDAAAGIREYFGQVWGEEE